MRSILKRGEDSPASQISLGEGLESLEEFLKAKSNIVNTPTSENALQADTGPFLHIQFLEGGGNEI